MKVNGYEVGQEPTDEEFAAYKKVKEHYTRIDVASFIDGQRERLTDEEFDLLCHRIGKLDCGEQMWEALWWEHEEIINGRSRA